MSDSENSGVQNTLVQPICYTPGPWAIQERSLTHGENEVLIKPVKSSIDIPTWIADVSESKNQMENAQAISAVPELIAACRMLKQWFDYGGDAPEMLNDCVDAAVVALRKAGCV